MRINKFEFIDKAFEWTLKETKFERLTLLVGASGVGKTQILKAIFSLKQVANGDSISGINWTVDFDTVTGQNYIWEGGFENKGLPTIIDGDEELKRNKPKISREKLWLNGKIILERNSKETYFLGVKTLKLSPQESIITILKEEDLIQPVYQGFKKLIFSDQSESQREPFRISLFNANKLVKKYGSLRKIQESDEDVRIKLYLASKLDQKTFHTIKDRFCEIFPQVEDLKIEPLDVTVQDVPGFFKDYPFIQMKEKGVDKWIQQEKISSGMFRTLIHISEVYLCPEGSIFLIDEFENSLGINCIDELTNDILKSSRQIQFIITSHHPYIINNIDFDNWKLVTRTSGVVNTSTLDKFISGKSKHDKFMQLIQLKQFETGTD
jgi:AAA15 family ATPase/GTPase